METKKYNVFQELFLPFYNIRSYCSFVKNGTGKTFLYGLVLAIVATAIFTGACHLGFNYVEDIIAEAIEDKMPDFELTEDGLELDGVIDEVIDDGGAQRILFYVNTDGSFDVSDVDIQELIEEGYSDFVISDSQRLILFTDNEYQTFDYSDLDLDDEEFNKDDLIDFIPVLKKYIIIIICIFALIWNLISVFLGATINSVVAMIISSIKGAKLSFGELYKICIHSYSIQMLLSMVFLFISVIPFKGLIAFGIAMFYTALAIKAVDEAKTMEQTDVRNMELGNEFNSYQANNYQPNSYQPNNYQPQLGNQQSVNQPQPGYQQNENQPQADYQQSQSPYQNSSYQQIEQELRNQNAQANNEAGYERYDNSVNSYNDDNRQ